LSRLESEAFATEEQALKLFKEAADLSQQVGRSADEWVSEGRTRTQGLSPEAVERSAVQRRTDDGWMGGQAQVDGAEARSARAWVYYFRYRAALRDADALRAMTKYFPMDGAGVDAELTKADEARRGGIEEVKQAMALLEKAHRALGKHWTVPAQSAGTVYLLALFGETDYVADAVQHYRNALKGRENEAFAEPFAARLADLEARGAKGSPPPADPSEPAEPAEP
jgi:hypothetical protein